MVSSDVVKALGWFANPMLDHFYLDNSIAELGKRAGLIRWCPQAVVEHLHYSVCAETEHDALYQSTEEKFGESDLAAFHEWRSSTTWPTRCPCCGGSSARTSAGCLAASSRRR